MWCDCRRAYHSALFNWYWGRGLKRLEREIEQLPGWVSGAPHAYTVPTLTCLFGRSLVYREALKLAPVGLACTALRKDVCGVRAVVSKIMASEKAEIPCTSFSTTAPWSEQHPPLVLLSCTDHPTWQRGRAGPCWSLHSRPNSGMGCEVQTAGWPAEPLLAPVGSWKGCGRNRPWPASRIYVKIRNFGTIFEPGTSAVRGTKTTDRICYSQFGRDDQHTACSVGHFY